jgi:CRISPR-associated protein Cas2
MFIVVAYDIADDRRRLRVMKMMEGYGEHVQESVFECDLERPLYLRMRKRLNELLNLRQDNVRIYHLCRSDIGLIEELGVGRPVQVAQEFKIISG